MQGKQVDTARDSVPLDLTVSGGSMVPPQSVFSASSNLEDTQGCVPDAPPDRPHIIIDVFQQLIGHGPLLSVAI